MIKRLTPAFVALSVVCLSSCGGEAILPAKAVSFDPILFFEGHTHGEGELRKFLGKPVHVSVDSIGRAVAGDLILDQTIREVGKPASTRRWVIRRVANNKYTGSLTDAVGPVTAKVSGSRAEIQYRMPHGLEVEQQLAEQPDRISLLNRLYYPQARRAGCNAHRDHHESRSLTNEPVA